MRPAGFARAAALAAVAWMSAASAREVLTPEEQAERELEVGDVDGNGKPDFVCILQDRVAIHLQGPVASTGEAGPPGAE